MPKGVYYRTEKTRKALSESHKGKTQSKEVVRKRSLAMTGRHWKVSEKGRKNMSEAHKGKLPTNLEAFIKSARERIGKRHPRWKGGYENRLMNNRKRRVLKFGNGGFHSLGDWGLFKLNIIGLVLLVKEMNRK